VIGLAGCYTNPVTGRRYAVIVSPATERQLGQESFAEVKRQEKISTDPGMNARVQRVGGRIAEVVGDQLPGADWEFVVFDSDELNAFALPGGKVGVYTGLLKLAENDSELAIVMGHEIGHVVARHGGKRMTEATATALVGIAGAQIVGSQFGDDKRDLFLIAYGGISTLGYVLPHSRADETEADLMGLQYAARSGYDPLASIYFWEKMSAAKEGPSVPVLLSTHPADADRIAFLKEFAPRFVPIYEAARREREAEAE